MFFKKHKQLLKECTANEKKCLEEFLDKLRYFTCTKCGFKIYSVENPPVCPKCGRKMLIIPLPKEHKSSKDVPATKTQRIAPPPKQPHIKTYISFDKDERVFNGELPKDSKPKSPCRQYGTNFIPPINTPPPDDPPNQYGNVGSMDNSEDINFLLKLTSENDKLEQITKQINYYRNNSDMFISEYLKLQKSSELINNITHCILYPYTEMVILLDNEEQLKDITIQLKKLCRNKVIEKEIKIINVFSLNDQRLLLKFVSKSTMDIKVMRKDSD